MKMRYPGRPLKRVDKKRSQIEAVREMEKEVKIAMRESGIDFTKTRTPEEQWKTALDAVKTRLTNEIRDLEKQRDTGEKAPQRSKLVYDAEANALKERRDALRNILNEIEGKKTISDEAKISIALKSAERSITEYERRINEKITTIGKRTSTVPETLELRKLRETRDQLKKTWQDMVKESRPVKSKGRDSLADVQDKNQETY